MQGRIHQALHGEGDIIGGERAAVGKVYAVAELEGYLLLVLRNLPGLSEFGLEFLRVTVDAHEHAAGQIADGERRVVVDEEGVEGLGLRAQAETQLATVLREG